jgi:hypothetical protein
MEYKVDAPPILKDLIQRLVKLERLEREVESLRMQAPPEVEIYHMLVEELNIPAGGSLVERVELMQKQLRAIKHWVGENPPTEWSTDMAQGFYNAQDAVSALLR